jgi:putative membrane protein
MAWFVRARTLATEQVHDAAGIALVALATILPLLVLVRGLSVVLALLQYHGFTLVETGRQLRVERGLLTRIRNQLPKRRIQAWRIEETVLHRWFGRQALRVDSAASTGGDEHSVRYLAPVAPPGTIRTIVNHVRPSDAWPPDEWHPVAPGAWRRLFLPPATVMTAAAAGLTWFYGPVGLLPLALVPMVFIRARATARFAAYSATDRALAVRDGWINRSWGLVDLRKVQALRISQSPFDRRARMATLWLDTAGASAADGVLRIRFLPENEARDLHDRIAGEMDGAGPSGGAAPADD